MVGKRKSKRFQLRSCWVKIVKSSFFGLRAKTLGKVALVDLSVTGLQVVTGTQLVTGDEYKIKIVTNIFPPMVVTGQVIWSKPHGDKELAKYYRTGFSFINLVDDYKEKLKKLESDPMLRQVTRSAI